MATPSAAARAESTGPAPPIALVRPALPRAPLILASPHSGRAYPSRFVAASALDPLTLRRSEDAYVDELFAFAPALGVPLLSALFPRAYVDVNRERYELDPHMFDTPLPTFANTRSLRVAGGLGTIARVVSDGKEIYRHKLRFEEVEARLAECYEPYHDTLALLIAETRARFGVALVLDCHSMPSVGGLLDEDAGTARPDIVLGDRYGSSCAPAITRFVDEQLRALGFRTALNLPYAGGYTTEHYGRPADNVSVLQIEINRGLYMDEARLEKSDGFGALSGRLEELVRCLVRANLEVLG
ncbi:MAG: N-formylglutamate amidohydrolase [Alphaproteobacteria bacterium]|nr:N-formylglutamate amidohydrolase [Alphaproteobacteria bacterium]